MVANGLNEKATCGGALFDRFVTVLGECCLLGGWFLSPPFSGAVSSTSMIHVMMQSLHRSFALTYPTNGKV